ncbi:SIR2 family protein [Cupriavidus sp. WGtm5]|uniref:SIR2 family protein n=1 Tax=Cupriavidus sp. WGtm5 TaxID=2919926 RepID=UPI002090BF04|nr:SIR2 family protein [Cupriavidus sp. WGtm5]MCO4892207.1 SIR2 family protein [Cupriavidus sp. WGtm5]
MTIEERLTEILRTRSSGAFLFIGSGFSRRYLGLEDWEGLLSRFCVGLKPFEYYRGAADGDIPTAAKLLAVDFNEHWWTAKEYASSVEVHKSMIQNATSALRIEISHYLATLDPVAATKAGFGEEIELLSSLNVDGIITTNWDLFLEHLFPDYKTYIGQNELLFSNPQEIGEIYKIHGCASAPSSLVLTSDDYVTFGERNPYLAAKLITVFVEHPVVFLGYSLSDRNISNLLRAISLCVGQEQIEQLRKNLIFVQRPKADEDPGISDTYLTIDGVQIPLVLAKTNNFAEVYRALAATRRKIPARVLRYCKEQLYELVKSLEPEKKLSVVDIDEIENKEDVEFLVGVGVASATSENVGAVGYEAIEVKDLIEDLLHENRKFDAKKIVESVVPRVGRYSPYLPVFKYLSEIGISTFSAYAESGLNLNKWVCIDASKFRVKVYAPAFDKRRNETMKEIIEGSTPENAATLIPFLPKEQIDLALLREFLIKNEDKVDPKVSNYATYFRKLGALYDRLRWGWT